MYALDMFLFHAVLAPVPDDYRRKLRLMAEYLDALAGNSRRLPLIGDDDGGRWFHPYGPREDFAKATLATCAEMLQCDAWAYEPEDLHEQAIWWLGPRSYRESGRGRQLESRFYPEAGIFVMRAQTAELIVDAGPFGPWAAGHSHSDTLSLLARLNGKEVLVDAGTYTYVADMAARNWFRGSAAHNTLRVDGLDQAAPGGPFSWRDKPQVTVSDRLSDSECDLIDAVVRTSGYAHRRKIVFFKRRLIAFVGDEVTGLQGEHEIESFWHLGCPRSRDRLVFDGATRVSFVEGGEHGRRSRVLGAQETAPVLIAATRRPLPARFWTVLDLSQSPRETLSIQGSCCSYAGLTVSW
jgi:hypothetical protein